MPFTRAGLTRPLPRFLPSRRGRGVRAPGSAGSTLTQQLGTWQFTVTVYLSFDGPNTLLPAWLDVTEFVETETSTITITRGRQDGLGDVNVGTCSLTVDNSDGRWTPSNPNGAWFGLIRKGAWLRVDLTPPSGVVSRRFTGFITALPTGWKGLYASTQVRASDRFLLLGQAPMLPAMTSAEVIYDSSTGVAQATPTAPGVVAHYPLSEALAGTGFALAFGDISGNTSPPLYPIPWGSTGANYLNFIKPQGAPGPGFDGASCVQFTPAALATGTVLTTTVQPWNNYDTSPRQLDFGVLELWLQTTFVNTSQAFATLWDPVGACAVTFTVDGTTGYLSVGIEATTAASAYGNTLIGTMIPGTTQSGSLVQAGVVLNDGNWHYVSIATIAVAPLEFVINIDGKTVWIGSVANPVSLNMNTLVIGGGFAGTSLQAFTGNIAGVSWILTGNKASNYPAHYRAGYNGFTGESVDQRIARVARYAGIPQPTTLQAPDVGFNPVPMYTPGVPGPWTNLGACVHLAAAQSIAGRQPLDVMREAARTENMPLYVDRSGLLTIQPCTTRYGTAYAWTVDAHDIDPSTQFPDDFQYLINQINVTPNGGATQTVNGTAGSASQKKYGVYSQSLATASLNTTEAANVGLAQIAANADPVPRLAPLAVEAATLSAVPGVQVPAAMNITCTPGYPFTLVTVGDAFYGKQVYQIAVPAGATASKDLDTLTGTAATPTVQYTFSRQVRVLGTAQSLSLHVSVDWLNSGGGVISSSIGSGVLVTGGSTGWTTLSVTGTAPAGTVTVKVRLVMGTTATAAANVQDSGLQWQTGALTAFQVPGAGSPNLLTLDQATAGQGTPYPGGGSYGPAWYDAVLATDISTLVTVTGLPPQAPASSLSVFVEGYTETISAGQHLFAFSTSPQVNANAIQLDSPTLGLLDSPALVLGY